VAAATAAATAHYKPNPGMRVRCNTGGTAAIRPTGDTNNDFNSSAQQRYEKNQSHD
jgi:hypothetical protein